MIDDWYEENPQLDEATYEHVCCSKFEPDNYSILYGSGGENGFDVVQWLNNAQVRYDKNVDLQFHVVHEDNDTNKEILSVTIHVEKNSLKLGDILSACPFGIIKKNRTGIGATYLELTSPRNSIIVVPTKALAAGKAKESKISEGKYKYLYVGSPVDDMHDVPSIREYLDDSDRVPKKIIVVADSLPKVIRAIGDCVYEDYFLMIDEIDTFQSDSTYRPKLEAAIDYYFRFQRQNRCMVSATVQEFSNPMINDEPVIEIEYLEEERRIIELIHTNNPNAIAKEEIERLFDSNPDQKIVIAYNKVQSIREVIENLKEGYRDECAILCSPQSRQRAGRYYREINDGVLPKRITFMTCPFFTGIDIKERFHLLSISNVAHAFTLLSPERYMQIAGRCRDQEKVFSETIIYSTQACNMTVVTPENYKNSLFEYVNDVMEFINHAQTLENKYSPALKRPHRYISNERFYDIKMDIYNKATISIFGNTKLKLVRQNEVTGEYQPAYFVIDALYETMRLENKVYTEPSRLYEVLRRDDMISSCHTENRPYTKEQQENDTRVKKEFLANEIQNVEELTASLISLYEVGELNDRELDLLCMTVDRKTQTWIKRFKRLYKFIPFNRLFTDMHEIIANDTSFRGYNNAAIFWALPDDHRFKADMCAKFRIDEVYSNEDIKRKMTDVYRTYFDKRFDANIHVDLLGEYVQKKRMNRDNSYKVIGYNKYDFSEEPLVRINDDDNLVGLLEFSKGVKDIYEK